MEMIAGGDAINFRTGREGFTLVEMIAGLGIIVILAGLTIGISAGVAAKRAEARVDADLAVIALGLDRFRSKVGDYPWVGDEPGGGSNLSSAGAAALLRALTGYRSVDPDRPQLLRNTLYLDATALRYGGADYDPNREMDPAGAYPVDPWGNPYLYLYNPAYPRGRSAWRNPGYILLSAGPDGRMVLPSTARTTGIVDAESYAREPDNADNITSLPR